MPIFSKKFDIKNIPTRAKRHIECPQDHEKIDDIQSVQINLLKKKMKFADGRWIQQSDTGDIGVIKKKLQKLEEENNLKQIKVDILLDMLTENLAELDILRRK